MKKTELTLADVLLLEVELNGFKDQFGNKVKKGILDEKLELDKRYHLVKIAKVCEKEKKVFETLRDTLVREHGTEASNGGYQILPVIEETKGKKKTTVPNPALKLVEEQLGKVLAQKVELEHKVLKIEDFTSVISEENVKVLFELFE